MNEAQKRDFKDVFIELRTARGMTQADAAKALGVSSSTIAMWEVGKRTPTRAKYEHIADYFNVDVAYLHGYTVKPREKMLDEFGIEYAPLSNDAIRRIVRYATALNEAGQAKLSERAKELLDLGFRKE